MRIPKRVNAALDWMEQHYLALGVLVALVAVALAMLLLPSSVGRPAASFILGLAIGGFTVHVRSSRRVRRARAEVDNLLRENGLLRHRNTVLASGVITREAQETQALMSIPEDDLLEAASDPQRTVALDELPDDDPLTTDELPEEAVADEPDDAAGRDESAQAEPEPEPEAKAKTRGRGESKTKSKTTRRKAKGEREGDGGEKDGGGGSAPREDDSQPTTVLTELPEDILDGIVVKKSKK